MVPVPVRLEVIAGLDPLRREQLTHELAEALASDTAVAASSLDVTKATPAQVPGAKGVTDVVAVMVAGAPFARPAADALIAAVQSWCARDRRNSVTIHDGDRSIEIVGSPTRRQRELVEEFLNNARGDDAS